MSARKMLNVVTSTSLVLASAALLSSTSAQAKSPPAATAVTHWNAIALRTVYTQARLPVPVGSLYLGFTSLAVYDAVLDATKGNLRHGGVSAPAAAVVAAHDVLAEYVPSFAVDSTPTSPPTWRPYQPARPSSGGSPRGLDRRTT
jgi:hypothetical protein